MSLRLLSQRVGCRNCQKNCRNLLPFIEKLFSQETSVLWTSAGPQSLKVGPGCKYFMTPSCIKSRVLKMSSVFRTKNLQDAGIDNVFFLEKSCGKMYTIFPRCNVNRGKVTSFGLTACSNVYYYGVPHCRFLILTGINQCQSICLC
jgi:hypothetical protein